MPDFNTNNASYYFDSIKINGSKIYYLCGQTNLKVKSWNIIKLNPR